MRIEPLSDIGPYRVVRPIASGGMAEIYLARQRGLEGVERTVVLKQILPEYADNDEFITMFLDEARLLAALSHPNIAQVFDLGRFGNTYYLAMEYVRGPTLGRVLARTRELGERLPRREALGIALSMAEALHYVHERRDEVGRPLNIVHRDLNPANVMLSYDGAVKIIDFGIAKAATRVYETRAGVIKGTYGYIAPEQLAGTAAVDRRADVFALGILLYEMIVGQHPFDTSDEPIIDRILEARYPRPRTLQPDIPRELDQLVASCLAPRAEGRPEDMRALIDALAGHLGAEGMVPTQTALAACVGRIVPDDEGPRPLRPLTSVFTPRLPAADPSGTRKLGLSPIEPNVDTEPRRPLGEESGTEPWNEPTVTFDDDEPLTLAGPSQDAQAAAAMLRAQHAVDDDATIARPRVDQDPEGDAPTRLLSISDPVGKPSLASREDPTDRGPRSSPPPSGPTGSGLPVLLLLVGGAVAMLLVAGMAFAIVRAIGDAPRALDPEPAAPISAGPSAPIELQILSEPAGATVYVDGAPAAGQTPLSVTLPRDTDHVWVRIALEGFHDEEREVIANVGEARFVLRRLE